MPWLERSVFYIIVGQVDLRKWQSTKTKVTLSGNQSVFQYNYYPFQFVKCKIIKQNHTGTDDNEDLQWNTAALEPGISFSEQASLNIIVLEMESQSFPCEYRGDI